MSYYENALKMRPYIEMAAASLSDAEALEVPMLFPSWKSGTDYGADQRIEYGGKLYRCIQGHTALADWTPRPLRPCGRRCPWSCGRNGYSQRGPMTHIIEGPGSPMKARNGYPTRRATYGSPAYTDGRK